MKTDEIGSMRIATKSITIILEARGDGGLRIHSKDVPGLILSGPNPLKVLRDLPTALEALKVVRPCPSSQSAPNPLTNQVNPPTEK